MTTLITGSAGFIGTNLLNHSQIDRPIIAIDLTSHDFLTGPIDLSHLDTTIHLAAITDVRSSLNNPSEVITSNITSTINALKTAQKANCKTFIFTSSMAASQPLSPYGQSKLACEAICSAADITSCIYRLPNIYGPHSLYKTSIVHKFIKNILRREPLTIYGDGSQTRDFLHVYDVCDLLLNPKPGIHNISTGAPVSISNLTVHLCDLSLKYLNYLPEVTYKPSYSGEITQVSLERTFSPSFSLLEGLEQTFKWYLENYDF